MQTANYRGASKMCIICAGMDNIDYKACGKSTDRGFINKTYTFMDISRKNHRIL